MPPIVPALYKCPELGSDRLSVAGSRYTRRQGCVDPPGTLPLDGTLSHTTRNVDAPAPKLIAGVRATTRQLLVASPPSAHITSNRALSVAVGLLLLTRTQTPILHGSSRSY